MGSAHLLAVKGIDAICWMRFCASRSIVAWTPSVGGLNSRLIVREGTTYDDSCENDRAEHDAHRACIIAVDACLMQIRQGSFIVSGPTFQYEHQLVWEGKNDNE
jgi:hypothetical protein